MNRVDFYLPASADDREVFTCRLIEKAYNERLTVWLWTDNAKQLVHYDQLLWVFKVNSFVPHDVISDDSISPAVVSDLPHVYLSTKLDIDHAKQVGVGCVVNLTQDVIPLEFDRIADIIDPDHVEAGRKRFAHYKQLDTELHYHGL